MADAKQLARIRRTLTQWNRWKGENRHVPVDLSGANLAGANLEWRDLSSSNLNGATLAGARLGGSDLSSAKLKDANLFDAILCAANLNLADLREANFSRASLRSANLSGAQLGGTNFTQAELSDTIFANVSLKDTVGLDSCNHIGWSAIDHRTLIRSWPLPEVFLRGCGLPESLITYLPSLMAEGAIQFYSCFISYSHADKSFARRLDDTLQGRGIRCWLDEKQLLAGDDVYDEVDRGNWPNGGCTWKRTTVLPNDLEEPDTGGVDAKRVRYFSLAKVRRSVHYGGHARTWTAVCASFAQVAAAERSNCIGQCICRLLHAEPATTFATRACKSTMRAWTVS